MEPNWYELISRAVEEGSARGTRRAFKHDEHPSEDTIAEHVQSEVMNSICEFFTFTVQG